MANPIITFENVSFSFKNKDIFNNLNFTFAQGESYWIKGNNGSGKTSLLRLIMDFHSPQVGQIIKLPQLIMGWAPAVDNSFFPRLTGKENLQFFFELSGKRRQLEIQLKSEIISEILKTPFYKMSSGMKQILILLRSVLMNPDLILWDEPFRSLDQEHILLSLELLKNLHHQNKTIILTSHLENSFADHHISTFIINGRKIVSHH